MAVVSHISDVYNLCTLKQVPVMGIEIADLLAREGRGTGIPILVEAIVTWLEQNGAP